MAGNSIVHRVDARVKILWLLVLFVLLFSSRTFETAAFALLLTSIACALTSISPLKLFPSKGFLFFIVIVPFIVGALFVSAEYGIASSLILFSALSFSILFIFTTEQNAIVAALRFFRLPKSTSFSLAMALYFIPVFERKFSSVRIAQASRGHSAKNPIPLVVPFMHSVMKRARNLSVSMDARAFDPDEAEVPYRLRMRKLDWFSLGVLLAVICIRIYLL